MSPIEVVREALSGADAWLVGGTVRDQLLGRRLRDVDVAVAGDPSSAAKAVARVVKGPVFRLSEAFGAWRAIDRGRGVVYDFSPLQGASIDEDLSHRDFTVNAMARALASGELLDPHGGRADLEGRTLRVLGRRAYAEDPLRPLRLARFAAELLFSPDPETERLTRESAERVTQASSGCSAGRTSSTPPTRTTRCGRCDSPVSPRSSGCDPTRTASASPARPRRLWRAQPPSACSPSSAGC